MSNAAVSGTGTEAGGEKDQSAPSWWHVNRKLLPMKAHYFLFFGSFSGVAVACILYCTKVGMSMSEIGTLYAVLPLILFFSKIIFGAIADKYQKHKSTYLASIFCMGAFMFSINFLPFPSDDVRHVTWRPADNATFACLRHPYQKSPNMNDSTSTDHLMQLTLCDRNASNQHFTVLSAATVTCDVSCDTSEFRDIGALFCEKDDLSCLRNDGHRYSLSATRNMEQTQLNLKISPDRLVQTGNSSSCATLPIASVTFHLNGTDTRRLSFQEDQEATSSRCNLKDTELGVSIACDAVCVASVKPSVYASPASARNRIVLYLWIWVAYSITWCAYGTLMSTSDTILLHLLGGQNEHFGKTRLFGSFGWGLMCPLMGFIIDKVSEGQQEKNYSSGFYVFCAFMLIDFIVNIPTKVHIPEKSKKLAKDVLLVLRRPSVFLTAVAVFVNGITSGFLWTFLIVFVTADLSGGMLFIIGVYFSVECFLSEIPFFMVSGWIVSKLGHSHSMSLSLFACGLKTFLYSLVYDVWYILFIALIHGATYGLLYVSMATYIAEIAPPGTAATLQGIFQGIFEGVGVSVGNLLGGYAYQLFGGREAFSLFGLVTMAASVVHLMLALVLKWIAHRSSSSSSDTKIELPSFVSGDLQSTVP